jgi:hypothetical protein
LELGRAPAKRDNRRCVIVEQQQNTTNTSTTVDECNGIQFYLGGSGSNLRMNKEVAKMDKKKRTCMIEEVAHKKRFSSST